MNKRQTYTNTPAAIGPSQGEECVGDTKQQQQQQGELHARAPLFHSFTNQEEAPPQEGALKDGSLTKTAFRGVTAAPSPASMDVNESPSPHIAINTYSTNRQEEAIGNLQISISKTRLPQKHQSASIVMCLSALMG